MIESVRCTECGGESLAGGHCFGHLTEDETAVVVQRTTEGETLNARDAKVSAEALDSFLRALGQATGAERTEIAGADFSGAEFVGKTDFAFVHFNGDVRFDHASFQQRGNFGFVSFNGKASFSSCRFDGPADFGFSEFAGEADFGKAVFSETADFFDATLSGKASFQFAKFEQSVDFSNSEFLRSASFHWAEFAGETEFLNARFFDKAEFLLADFSGGADFTTARFSGDAGFTASRFRGQVLMRQITVAGALELNRVIFDDMCRIDVAASSLNCFGARFGGRTELNARWAEIDLEDCAFQQRARLTGAGPIFDEDDELASQTCRVDRQLDAAPRPRLITLRKADVENLAIEGVDLRSCLFAGAHGLDRLRLEGSCDFAEPPRYLRYTNRRTLAEEHHWRTHRGDSGWNPPECRQPSPRTTPESPDPAQIAAVYRSLRKAYEDGKDEPGAADFYYGEMEMRRLRDRDGHGPRALLRSSGERVVLEAYWLVAGYGLRAGRAVASLLLVILLGAVLLNGYGFDHASHPPAAIFAIQSSINLLRPPAAQLTVAGELIQIGLRLLGPLLLALMLLSLRSRVKR